MIYLKFEPGSQLEKFIRNYYIWECDKYEFDSMYVEAPPTGYPITIFNYGDPSYLIKNNLRDKLPLVSVVGQATKIYSYMVRGTVRIFGCIWKPYGLYHVLKNDISELNNQQFDLTKLIDVKIDQIISQLANKQTYEEKKNVVENYLVDLISSNSDVTHKIELIAEEFEMNNGLVKVSEMADKYQIGIRYLQKEFKKRVGLTPKQFCKIKRMAHICDIMSEPAHINWLDILHEGGYYDQAHFIKDFKEYMIKPPKYYFEDNIEIVKTLWSIFYFFFDYKKKLLVN
mgnify:CR=1 FL=1